MVSKIRWVTFLLIGLISGLSLAPMAFAVDLDPAYVSAFGWGSIAVSDLVPAKGNYDPAQFDYRDGKFYINRAPFNLRLINKDGRSYQSLLDEVRSVQKAKYNNVGQDNLLYITIWLSHDADAVRENGTWPQVAAKAPPWDPYGEMKFDLADDFLEFNTSSYFWEEQILNQIPEMSSWIAKAKPGYKIYVAASVGFRRDAVELKRWDAGQGRYVIPWEFIQSKPIAAATIVLK